MTKVTAQARHKQSREAALEEMSLQTSAKSRQRGCGCYVLRQTVPHVCGVVVTNAEKYHRFDYDKSNES